MKSIIDQIIQAISGFKAPTPEQAPKVPQTEPKPAAEPVKTPQTEPKVEVNWSDPKSKINSRFSVSEALTLPSWGVMHIPSEDEKKAIKGIADKVAAITAEVEAKLGKKLPINVHAFMRPGKANIPGSQWDGKDYNRYIYETQVWKNLTAEEKVKKTVPNSPHRTGHAIDFHFGGYEGKEKCAEMRQILLPLIEKHGLRMEDMSGGWIHLDDLPVVNKRFFKP